MQSDQKTADLAFWEIVMIKTAQAEITSTPAELSFKTLIKIIDCKAAWNLLTRVTSAEEVGTRSKINLRINSILLLLLLLLLLELGY